jgi:hypothetical protein
LDKVKEVISSAGEMLAEAEASLAHERAVKNDAFRKIAEVVLGARNAGVEMGVQSPEVEEYVEILKRQALRQPKTQRYQGTYKLNNEGTCRHRWRRGSERTNQGISTILK